MGPEEGELERELGRRWLLWRDEELREGTARTVAPEGTGRTGGTTDPDRLRAALIRRQRERERSEAG